MRLLSRNRGCWVIVGLVGPPEEQISGRAVWGIATLHHHMHSPGTTKPRDSGSGHCLPWCLLWHRTRNHLWLPPMPQLKLARPLRLEAGIVATLKCLLTQQMPKLWTRPWVSKKHLFFPGHHPPNMRVKSYGRETNYSYPIEQGMITSATAAPHLLARYMWMSAEDVLARRRHLLSWTCGHFQDHDHG